MRNLEETDDAITANSSSTKILWWLLSSITTILVLSLAAWGASMSTRVGNIEDRHNALDQRLGRIEGKLDLLIEQGKYRQSIGN